MEPAGVIMPFAGIRVPAGYLPCDGRAVSRTTYATLFGVIGTTYGAGDGSTTFALPNLGGRVPLGTSSSHTLGTSGGAETVTLQTANLPAHGHTIPAHGHAHTIKATTPQLTHSITTQPSFTYDSPKSTKSIHAISSVTAITVKGSTNAATASVATNASITAHAASNCTMSGSITNKAAYASGAKGDGKAHNNMQPYIAMYYIISTGEA